jgi:hypothetical protein
MGEKNQIAIEVETIQKIVKELNEISIFCSEPHLKLKIEALHSFVSNILDVGSEISAEDVIYGKMVEVKHSNPDLHFKLYKLYRNLISSRISELDAMVSYESCLSIFSLDVTVF